MEQEKYFISVGEPWDFNSVDGENIINGIIIKILSATCIIFKANYLLDFEGVSGDIFVLYPRYAEKNFIELKNGVESVAINGNLLIGDFDENENEEILREKSKFVLAGTIRT
ncbi:hypothetical protein FBD94_15390 [Pedobacter hiemivivus]|uniref:Uncharacterized protein n=1 Tax=Pedobacter hiemivivus TaxID=2530454 RepID=A0A4U1G8Q1_9SPHI|nr:hypothetical protein [Pedobacter hiemivivus]TKC60287.1 hypothetical protein FBD94_15390 [Pedobacter hiemivivus]